MAPDSHAVETAAIAAATAALDGYAFHLVPERGTEFGGGEKSADDPGGPETSPTSFRTSKNVVLLAHSTGTFRRLASDTPNVGEVCLDVGSAHGDATKRLADAVGCPENVVGIDVSPEFIRLSTEKYPALKFHRMDVLEDMPFFVDTLTKMKPQVVFVDIGGVRAAEALVRVLPAIAKTCASRVVAIKCEALARIATETLKETLKKTLGHTNPDGNPKANPNLLPPRFWATVCQDEVTNARSRSSHKAHAGTETPATINFARYPLRYPVKTNETSGVEICRFHNYALQGCLRLTQGRCELDHNTCHWCLGEGHAVSDCPRAATAATATTSGLEASAVPVRDPNDGTQNGLLVHKQQEETSSFIYVVGGRNRGQTVGVVERLCLNKLTWSRAPRLREPRGSHGVAVAGGCVFAIAGGGVRSNLHDCEVLRVGSSGDAVTSVVTGGTEKSKTSSWEPAGFVLEARHAVAACSTGDWGVYLIGGWGNGDSCSGAVDLLRLDGASDEDGTLDPSDLNGGRGWVPSPDTTKKQWWSLCALQTPRKLHAAAGLGDGRLFVWGGRTGDDPNQGPTPTAEAYCPETNKWRFVKPLPGGGACACACVDDENGHEKNVVYVLTWGSSGNTCDGKSKSTETKTKTSGDTNKPVGTNRMDKRAKKVGDCVYKLAIDSGVCEADAVAEGKAARAAAFAKEQKATSTDGANVAKTEHGGLWRYLPDSDTYEFVATLPLPEWYGFTCV